MENQQGGVFSLFLHNKLRTKLECYNAINSIMRAVRAFSLSFQTTPWFSLGHNQHT